MSRSVIIYLFSTLCLVPPGVNVQLSARKSRPQLRTPVLKVVEKQFMKNPTPSAHKTSTADVAIIGGGAAGLAAAIAAREHSQDARIYLLDGAKSLGAKILVSGGGRCNVTHDCVSVPIAPRERHENVESRRRQWK